jgi:YaiO family outer membrane protein
MRALLNVRPLILSAALVAAVGPPSARAQSGPFVEWSSELSAVSTGAQDTTWHVARIAAGVQRDGQSGWTLGAERHRRADLVDWAAGVGGFRRAGPWTVSGAVSRGVRPDFLYRYSLDAELARIVGSGFVVHGGYRHLRFRDARVHIAEPALSWYVRDHELQVRGFLVRNTTTDRQAATVLVRGSAEVAPRVRVAAGAAVGSRIFDVTTTPNTAADGWVAFGSARVQVSRRLSLMIGAGGAEEDPLFTQRTLSLGARWTF